MIIKNYHTTPMQAQSPALDLQIIENVTDVLVYARCYNADDIGDLTASGVTTVYGGPEISDAKCTQPSVPKLARHIDFTRNGVRSRLIVQHHAYICNDEGRTVEKVSA